VSDAPPPIPFELPPAPAPLGPPGDTVARGCGFGLLITILSIALVSGAAYLADGKKSDYIFMSWGYVQWIGTIALIMRERSRGYRKSVIGLIIAGCMSTLLGTACAAMLSNLSFR
jgi:hypothetical protein